MRFISAVPAYGRDYKTKKAVLADWDAGMDFLIQDPFDSGYINKHDKPSNVELHIRYDKLTKVCVVR